MKLQPEERKALAGELLASLRQFKEGVTASAVKFGMAPEDMLDQLDDLAELEQLLQKETDRP